jgi:hypothetical protein
MRRGRRADSCLSVAQLGEHEDQVVRTPQIVRMPMMRVPEPAAQQRTRAQRGDAPGSGGARAQCGQRGRCVGNCTPRWRVGSCCVGVCGRCTGSAGGAGRRLAVCAPCVWASGGAAPLISLREDSAKSARRGSSDGTPGSAMAPLVRRDTARVTQPAEPESGRNLAVAHIRIGSRKLAVLTPRTPSLRLSDGRPPRVALRLPPR